MKKKYMAPDVYFEEYEMSQSIAANCSKEAASSAQDILAIEPAAFTYSRNCVVNGLSSHEVSSSILGWVLLYDVLAGDNAGFLS